MKRFLFLFSLCLLISSINADQFKGLKWRNIGPFRGGRANAIAGHPLDAMTYYVGYTGGGMGKTDDGGMTWRNISDGFFKVGSIGDIAVSESDPNVIYVGTGEHAVRGVMTSYGDGVYKSTDGGKTWKNIGLEKTRHISDVVVHPGNPDVVYVAAQGTVHGPNAERGVYKSTDGGATWKRVLFVDENSGASSLTMDMTNPRILYAATWQHRRYPWRAVVPVAPCGSQPMVVKRGIKSMTVCPKRWVRLASVFHARIRIGCSPLWKPKNRKPVFIEVMMAARNGTS
jgi:hypothetical protein